MSFTSAEVVGALETLRRAVATGEDISAYFGAWSGLERQTLVRAINTPGTGASAGDQKAESSGVDTGAGQAADPCPEPRTDSQASQGVPPSAHPVGPAGSTTSPAKAASYVQTGGGETASAGIPGESSSRPATPERPAPSAKGAPPPRRRRQGLRLGHPDGGGLYQAVLYVAAAGDWATGDGAAGTSDGLHGGETTSDRRRAGGPVNLPKRRRPAAPSRPCRPPRRRRSWNGYYLTDDVIPSQLHRGSGHQIHKGSGPVRRAGPPS